MAVRTPGPGRFLLRSVAFYFVADQELRLWSYGWTGPTAPSGGVSRVFGSSANSEKQNRHQSLAAGEPAGFRTFPERESSLTSYTRGVYL